MSERKAPSRKASQDEQGQAPIVYDRPCQLTAEAFAQANAYAAERGLPFNVAVCRMVAIAHGRCAALVRDREKRAAELAESPGAPRVRRQRTPAPETT